MLFSSLHFVSLANLARAKYFRHDKKITWFVFFMVCTVVLILNISAYRSLKSSFEYSNFLRNNWFNYIPKIYRINMATGESFTEFLLQKKSRKTQAKEL